MVSIIQNKIVSNNYPMSEDKPIKIPNNIEDCQSLIKELSNQINKLNAKINELTHRLQLLTVNVPAQF